MQNLNSYPRRPDACDRGSAPKSFTSQATLAHWTADGAKLIIGMFSEKLSCADLPPLATPPGRLEADLLIPKPLAVPGAALTYALGDTTGVNFAAGRIDFDSAGHPVNWSDTLSEGNGAFSENASKQVSGWVTASDTSNGTSLSGAFAVSICEPKK